MRDPAFVVAFQPIAQVASAPSVKSVGVGFALKDVDVGKSCHGLGCRVVARTGSVVNRTVRLRPRLRRDSPRSPLRCERRLEARGVEPLSSSLSTQTSTCLSGEIFEKPTLHQHTVDFRASTNFLHRPARSLRRPISLLSTFGAVAGVQLQTSRSIKPRERDLGDLRLFVLARFLTRPTNHPRHAACASNNESKPVRPRLTNIQCPSFLGKMA